ncbi:MAG: hypothetical protein HWN67_22610 [Candidatus Helarchaeota archaeon]|nr:hypothetical protein [Candidatus Helarchaeota archaeon]
MAKINWYLMIGTICIMGFFIFLAVYFYSLIGWLGFIIISILASLSEIILLHYLEKKAKSRKKQKITQLKLAIKEDIKSEIGEEKRLLIAALNKETIVSANVLESFRIYLRINIAEINELILDVDETYLKSVELVKNGNTKKAKEGFNSKISNIFNRIYELDTDFNFKLNNLKTSDLKFRKIISSFKDEWIASIDKIKNIIKQTQEKFEINTNFLYYIEDIFRFEIENQRKIEKEDILELDIPKDQIKKLLKYINESIKIKLNELDKDKKRKLAEIGKKIISHYVDTDKKPNLPEMVIKLGIGINESKELLSYLKEIGMIDEIKYHIV